MPIITTFPSNAIYGPDEVIYLAGGFDLFHIGHLNLLKNAKLLGGKLNVAVLSDNYIRSYKGASRPIQPETERLAIVKAIRYVDYAWITDVSPNSPQAIANVNPRAIVYGIGDTNDNDRTRLNRASQVQIYFPNIDIYLLPRFLPDAVSTTLIIRRIQEIS